MTTSDSPGSRVYLGSVRVDPWLLLRCTRSARDPRPLAPPACADAEGLAEPAPTAAPAVDGRARGPSAVDRPAAAADGAPDDDKDGPGEPIARPPALLGRLPTLSGIGPGPASSSAVTTRSRERAPEAPVPGPEPKPEFEFELDEAGPGGGSKASGSVIGVACARALTACSVRSGTPVRSTSSAVTLIWRGFGASRSVGVDGDGRRRRGGAGARDGGGGAGGGLGGLRRAIVRLVPSSCSTVTTRGPPPLPLCLCDLRGAVRSAPRSCSAVSSSRVTRAVRERPALEVEVDEVEGGLEDELLAAMGRAA